MFTRWIILPTTKSFLLVGPRRAGKSTLLKTKFPNFAYSTLDDLDEYAWAKNDAKGFIEHFKNNFIIDEAQRVPLISLPIKKLIDDKKAIAILTGSSGLNLKDQIFDSLAGRIEILKLPTCCFGENFGNPIHKITEKLNPLDEAIAKREFKIFFKYGGFPEVLNTNDENEKETILKNYKNSYFTRDIAQIANLENIEAIKAMYGALIKGLSSRYEINNLSRETGLSIPTTKKYFNSLLGSGLTFKLYGYHLGPAKRYIAKSKNYFLDQGILQSLSDEYSKGQALENFVVSEIEKRRQLGIIQAEELYYYESSGGLEVDVVIEEKDKIYAIEIKSSAAVGKKDFKNLNSFNLETKKELIKIVFYLGDKIEKSGDIHLIPAWNFFRATF
jgi:predicted AAA+ superfamily ATPase